MFSYCAVSKIDCECIFIIIINSISHLFIIFYWIFFLLFVSNLFVFGFGLSATDSFPSFVISKTEVLFLHFVAIESLLWQPNLFRLQHGSRAVTAIYLRVVCLFVCLLLFVRTWCEIRYQYQFTKFDLISFAGFGYGHPNGLHPYMLNMPGWIDAYMSMNYYEYFRHQPHNPQFAKGKYHR